MRQPLEQTFAKHYPDVEFRDIRGRKIDGFINIGQLAKALGVWPMSLTNYLKADLFRADFYNLRAAGFTARTAAFSSAWTASRRSKQNGKSD